MRGAPQSEFFDAHPADQYAQLGVDLRSPSPWARVQISSPLHVTITVHPLRVANSRTALTIAERFLLFQGTIHIASNDAARKNCRANLYRNLPAQNGRFLRTTHG